MEDSGTIEIMTPVSCASTITARFNKFVRHADIDGFQAFVDSDDFVKLLSGAGTTYRRGLLRAYGIALKAVERRARITTPKPIGQGKVSWTASMRDRLYAAYAMGLDDEKAGRLLGVTTDAARLARKRVLGICVQPA
jgi:hypothetical protein